MWEMPQCVGVVDQKYYGHQTWMTSEMLHLKWCIPFASLASLTIQSSKRFTFYLTNSLHGGIEIFKCLWLVLSHSRHIIHCKHISERLGSSFGAHLHVISRIKSFLWTHDLATRTMDLWKDSFQKVWFSSHMMHTHVLATKLRKNYLKTHVETAQVEIISWTRALIQTPFFTCHVKLIADPTCRPEISSFLSSCSSDRILAHGQFLLAGLWRRAGILNFAS